MILRALNSRLGSNALLKLASCSISCTSKRMLKESNMKAISIYKHNTSFSQFLPSRHNFSTKQSEEPSTKESTSSSSSSSPSQKPIATEETGGYYKELGKDKANDPIFDPYYPYVWIHKCASQYQPALRFMRIDQNFGRMLLLLPNLWGIVLASSLGGLPHVYVFSLFCIGSVFAHAAACAIDDYMDYPVDIKLERTKKRPLCAGTLSFSHARIIIAGLLVGTFGVLACLSPLAVKFGLLATPGVFMYPLMKRWFQYPQVFLAFALNLGVFMGYAAVANSISLPVVLPLYAAGVCWTIYYDSIYAFQDIAADKAAGLYSTSQKMVKHAKKISGALAATALGLHTYCGFLAGLHPSFFLFSAAGGCFLGWQVYKLDPYNAPLCDHLLNISYKYGFIILLGYIVGLFFAEKKKDEKNI